MPGRHSLTVQVDPSLPGHVAVVINTPAGQTYAGFGPERHRHASDRGRFDFHSVQPGDTIERDYSNTLGGDPNATFTVPISEAQAKAAHAKSARLPSNRILQTPCENPMPFRIEKPLVTFAFIRSAASMLKIAGLVYSIAIIAVGEDALAQAKKETAPIQTARQKQFFPVSQMSLTEKQIQGFLAATEEVNATTDGAAEDIDKLRPETIARLDAVAKKNGLANYDEYRKIDQNAGLIMSGFDDVTRKYVGREALIMLRIARVKADKKMSADEKKDELSDLNDQLQFALPPVEYKGNIDLVAKYYDRLRATARAD